MSHGSAAMATTSTRNKPPRRLPNKTVRSREYLTAAEVEKLIRAAGKIGRHRQRDAALILIAYRHGLRVGELVRLRWDQVDLGEAILHVTRSKNGTTSNHPPVHPHMLRHACGYKLANDGHDTRAIQHYLGHKNIVHTVRYTELASDRFKGFWRD